MVLANAGISVGMDVMAQTFATNNTGLAATFHPFVKAMVQRGSGALVGIGSVAGILGLPGHGAYGASKAAVAAGPLRRQSLGGHRGGRVIPWQMGMVAKLLRLLPNAVFDKALAGRPRKQRQDTV